MTRSLVFFLLCGVCAAEGNPKTVVVPLDPKCSIHFLNGKDAQAAIVEDKVDPFFRSLSRIDIEARLGKALPNIPQAKRVELLKQKLRAAVQAWSAPERERITEACKTVLASARKYSDKVVPRQWKFVLTDGTDAAGSAYTRHEFIVLPKQLLHQGLARLVAHETVHVFTRHHKKARDRLYARLGFRHVGAIDAGELTPRLLTNPDAPVVEHVIRVKVDGTGVDAALVIFAKSEFKGPHPMGLFYYLDYALFAAAKDMKGTWRLGKKISGGPRFTGADGFYDQVGRNTGYVIHPEEILAENLATLLTASRANPDKLLDDLGNILKAAK